MTDIDARRFTVPAPEAGRSAAPPPPRRPVVVRPHPGDAAPAAPDDPPRTPPAPSRVVVPAPVPGTAQPDAGTAPAASPSERQEKPAMTPQQPSSAAAGGPRRRLIPRRRHVLIALGVLVVLGLLGTAYGFATFRRIERVDVTLAATDGTNYLIVGSDTRDGVDPNDPNAGAILGDDTVGGPSRSDTILILRSDGAGNRLLSVPRDLYVTIADTGTRSRINAAFNGGPQRLVDTLDDQLGLPVHRYLEIDFVAFGDVVDALGGIEIEFAHPAFDTHSGLQVNEAGVQRLDGTQALAFVRSRFYTEVIDGRNVPQGNGDLGRVVRQQQFLAALGSAVSGTRNPITLARIGSALADGMKIDDEMSFLDAWSLFRRLRGIDPTPNTLATTNFTTGDGAQVLRLLPAADETLRSFGSTGAAVD